MKADILCCRRPALPALVILICLWLLSPPAIGAEESDDSTSVRDPRPPDKSFGEGVLDVFSEVLKLPLYPLKGITYSAVWTATESPLSRLIFRPPVDFSVYPIASYSSNAGLKGGIGMYHKNLLHREDMLRVKAYYSMHQYQRYGASLHSPHFFGSRLGLDLEIDYRKRPWESFYGLGTDSREVDEVSYTLEQSEFCAGLTWRASGSTRIGLFAEYVISNVSDGRNDERPRVISEIAELLDLKYHDYRSSRHITTGAGLQHDSRDHPGQPLRGGEEKLRLAYNHGVNRSNDLEYFSFEADLTRYFELFRKRVLAARVRFNRVTHDEAEVSIPFYLRSALGGEEALRGYRSQRFVDNDYLVASIEYRYPIWLKLDGFIFHEQGRVSNSMVDDFDLSGFKHSTGMGIRAWGRDGELGRVLFAVSEEGVRFYVHMGADW